MSAVTMNDLATRLGRLERQNRALRRLLLAVAGGGLGLAVTAGWNAPDGVQKVVEAERFVLRDAQGKERIRIGTGTGTENNGPVASVTLFDKDGKEISNFFADHRDRSTGLFLMTPDKMSSTVLYMKENGSTHLAIQKAERVRCSIGIEGKENGPSIYVLDEDGGVRFQAPKP